MDNQQGLQLQHGDLVWTTGFFENVWFPYRVISKPYCEDFRGRGKYENVFVSIVHAGNWTQDIPAHKGERMNVSFLSRNHPKGWLFVQDDSELQVVRKALEVYRSQCAHQRTAFARATLTAASKTIATVCSRTCDRFESLSDTAERLLRSMGK